MLPFKQTLYLSFTLSFNCLISEIIFADVISSTVATDIQEPSDTYFTSAPTLLNLFAKTVLEEGNCIADKYDGCTFADVLKDINSYDNFKPEVKVHVTGDDYLDDGLISNAKIRQRGALSRRAAQKSFRIKFDKNIPLWRGERRIQLIKSPFDLSRIRNKLSYDLFAGIPHIPSMRSQFVNFTLEDQGVIQDLGLYTQVEYFGKEYLERRGWDKDSGIYKVESFNFQYNASFALDVDGVPLDEDAFEKHIEIKRGDSHHELVEMIQAVSNPDLDFQAEIFDRYFNQDNYLTWFAVNILTNNIDTRTHNYYLYKPINTENFYFVPWDYDFAWGGRSEYFPLETIPRWSNSHAYYWRNIFHERFLRSPGNLDLLKGAVAEVRQKYLTTQKIGEKRDAYYDVIFPLISTSPDWDFIDLQGTDPEKIAEYNHIFDSLSNQVEENYTQFLAQINDPMPFYLNSIADVEDNNLFFNWNESESLTDQVIVYELQISTDKVFSSISTIQTITDIRESEYSLNWIHPKGKYYFRVVSRDSANPTTSWQIGFDSILRNSDRGSYIYGVKEFFVSEDGEMNPPEPNQPESIESEPNINSGGGSFSWLVLLISMLIFRKRYMQI